MNEKIYLRSREYTRKDGSIHIGTVQQKYYTKGTSEIDGRSLIIHPDKLSAMQKREIYEKRQTGVTIVRLAKDYNVCAPTIAKAIKWVEANKEVINNQQTNDITQ